MLKAENKKKLIDILKYHVIAGRIYSDQALATKQAKTLEGRPIEIGIVNNSAKVNNAGLIATDIDASNGVIHVIDSVLLPPEEEGQAQLPPNGTTLQKHVTEQSGHVRPGAAPFRHHVYHTRQVRRMQPVFFVSRRCGR
ncbi:MAG: fasciclin domain-containing protein [Planctomycetaceae bacterium]|nr:fasciclin domain-containing protein [Planctomycetaceae bacterium]